MRAVTGGGPADSTATAEAVLAFWFGSDGDAGDARSRSVWFAKDPDFDRTIAERFGPTIESALRGELQAWADAPRRALAQVLVLDQFTRNAFRDTARAFAGDSQALAAASRMVGTRQDEALTPLERSFVYMPFEHAEGLAMQDESVRLFERLAGDCSALADRLDYARRHRAVIERFGRFPHRNRSLGRRSTAEELAHLAEPGSGF